MTETEKSFFNKQYYKTFCEDDKLIDCWSIWRTSTPIFSKKIL